jgi:transposase-like protein
MKRRIFTRDQIEKLSSNPNVLKCSEKSITYTSEFKIRAVGLCIEQGMTPKEVFTQAGFDLEVIGKKKPTFCLRWWKHIYREQGKETLIRENRGKKATGRTKTKYENDAEKIKYLEAQVAYLKAENDFLAKLRALRAE